MKNPDKLWMDIAIRLSEQSHDDKTKVGCIIVSSDNMEILAIGYNGDQSGGPNKRESMEDGKSGFIHAEENALIKLNYGYHKDKTMYVTHSPCKHCAKRILQSGIKYVIYKELRYDSGIDILIDSGVTVIQWNQNLT